MHTVLVTVRGVTTCSLTSAISEEQQFLSGILRFFSGTERLPRIVQGNYRNIAYDFESRDNDPNFVFFFLFRSASF